MQVKRYYHIIGGSNVCIEFWLQVKRTLLLYLTRMNFANSVVTWEKMFFFFFLETEVTLIYHVCMCLSVCLYACMHACMHVCIYIYIYIHTHWKKHAHSIHFILLANSKWGWRVSLALVWGRDVTMNAKHGSLQSVDIQVFHWYFQII